MLSLRVFLSLLALASFHRFLANPFLNPSFNESGLLKEALVGSWSDIWVSFLLSLPFFVIEKLSLKQNLTRKLEISWIFLWVMLTAGHQTYVEYFRFQIIPFHLSYIFDTSFLAANGKSNFSGRPLATLIFGLMECLVLFLVKPKDHVIAEKSSKFKKLGLFVLFTTFCTILHAANIKWRVQWFVPENLQSHFVERLFINIKTKKTPRVLDPQEVLELAELNHQATILPVRELLNLNKKKPSKSIEAIKQSLVEIKATGRNPILILFIAESFRPSDSGWTRTPTDLPSITPSFDQLTQTGVLFEHAYSSGPVTRGGQESMWCGTPSATDSSLMRSFRAYQVDCLPDVFHKNANGVSLWAHGGDAKFDSQLSFWKSHNVGEFILKSDFGNSTPSTGWGISDLALANKVSASLLKLLQQNAGKFINIQFLSVSNHIPWDLPSDASDPIRNLEVTHPSQKTTAYFDFALGQFVNDLKAKNLWQDTLLVVASDHGNLETPRNASYAMNKANKFETLLSHINLVLSGGVTEKLVAKKTLPKIESKYISQIQIAPFLAEVSGDSQTLFFDEPLFGEKSPWPVTSDLNQYLYLPESDVRIEKEKAIIGILSTENVNMHRASLRYRAYLQSLYQSR